jgi:hypothetical protein
MTLELIIAILSAIAAIAASGFTILGQIRLVKFQAELMERRDANLRRTEAETMLSRYREPMLNAAYELQGRLYNILRLDFLKIFYLNGDERERQYAVENTLYVIAQYLGWTEIIRRDIHFLNLGEAETTRKFIALQDQICNLFLESNLGKVLRIFRGEQRAIGEMMIITINSNSHCMGYAQFLQMQNDAFQYWFEPLREHIDLLAKDWDKHSRRLLLLQNALVDLIDFFDPNYMRYPQSRRTKVA